MKKLAAVSMFLLFLAGCATSARYVPYTAQKFLPKDKYAAIAIYPPQQAPARPYQVIGRVEVSGDMNDGANQDMLNDRAQAIARKKGADAIINGLTEVREYTGTYIVPGRTSVRHHHHGPYANYHFVRYRPTEYYPYTSTSLRFRGELVVYSGP